MGTSKNTIAAYIQAAISLLLIMCTFIPFLKVDENINLSISFLCTSTIIDEAESKYKICGYAFIIYFMLHTLNIFYQAHGNHKSFSSLLSILGFGGMIVIHTLLDDYKAFKVVDYSIGFYLILILLFALLIIPTLISTSNDETEYISETEPEEQI